MSSARTGEPRTLPVISGEVPVTEHAAELAKLRSSAPQITPAAGGNKPVPTSLTLSCRDGTDASATALWLRRADQWLLGSLLIALLILLCIARWKLSGGGRTEIEIVSQQPREYFYAIDVNRASWVEWAQLDGIGEKLARRIVQDREEHGPFKSVSDLERVRGLGSKLIEKLRPFLQCPGDAEQAEAASDSKSP